MIARSIEREKQAAAEAGAALVSEGMRVGLGTTMSGCILSIERREFQGEALARFIGHVRETFPALARNVPPGTRAEALQRLTALTQDPALAAHKADFEAVIEGMKAPPPK